MDQHCSESKWEWHWLFCSREGQEFSRVSSLGSQVRYFGPLDPWDAICSILSSSFRKNPGRCWQHHGKLILSSSFFIYVMKKTKTAISQSSNCWSNLAVPKGQFLYIVPWITILTLFCWFSYVCLGNTYNMIIVFARQNFS